MRDIYARQNDIFTEGEEVKMFLCDRCAPKHGVNRSETLIYWRSLGECEDCHRLESCMDVPFITKKKKWFAAAILAIKETDEGALYENKPCIFQAATKEGAHEILLQKAKTEWFPESDGWSEHRVDVIEFPEEAR
jgi:hypothetical protein